MDRRQVKTRQAVYKAFVSLLGEKSYSAITIQDILDRADIGRSTFYAHFKTKDDLLDGLCGEIFGHVFAEKNESEPTHDFSKKKGLISELTHVLYHLKDNEGYVKAILASDSAEVFMRYFREHLRAVFEGEIEIVPFEIPRDYYLNHLVSGFVETVRWGMSNDCTPEELVRLFERLYMR